MDFNGQYLTYDEYKALGGTLDLTPFNLLEYEARKRIDIRTFNRLKEVETKDMPMEVKMCEYNLINSMTTYSETLNGVASKGNVASESIDGYSISYITSAQIGEIIKSKSSELDDIIRNYLIGVEVNDEYILYAGVK